MTLQTKKGGFVSTLFGNITGVGAEPMDASYWHDIPFQPLLGSTNEYFFVCEIPKYSCAKMEVQTGRKNNPIQQDEKDGLPRYFKKGPSPINYGMIPQTWESPLVPDAITGLTGDGDPIDVVDISSQPCIRGQVKRVKVLAALAMIDDGETDWKIVAISPDDEQYTTMNRNYSMSESDIDDMIREESLLSVKAWFRDYKAIDCRKICNISDGDDSSVSHCPVNETLTSGPTVADNYDGTCKMQYKVEHGDLMNEKWNDRDFDSSLCTHTDDKNVTFMVLNATATRVQDRFFVGPQMANKIIFSTHEKWNAL